MVQVATNNGANLKPQNTGLMTKINSLGITVLGTTNNIRQVGTIQKMANPTNLFTEKDFIWKPKNEGLNVNRDVVRFIEVTEYQPNKFYDWIEGQRKYFNRIISAGVTIGSLIKKPSGQYILTMIDGNTKVQYQPGSFNTEGIDGGFYKNFAISRGIGGILNLPMEEVVNYFSTSPVARYVVPYVTQDYLTVDGAYGWNVAEPKESNMSLGLATVNNFLDSVASLTPQKAMKLVNWSPNNFQNPKPVTTTFHLYNETIDDLALNLKFIYSLSSGTYWTTIGSFHYSSNFYRIRCPNIFDYYYCGMQIEVVELGTKRLLNPEAKQVLQSKIGGEMLKNEYVHFPDGYEIRATFKPLVPNNFNIYVNSLLKNNYEKQV